jgi:hypothetical protein
VSKYFNNHRFILFLILVALILFGWFGERIPSNNETGWDGKHYANYAANLPQLFQNKQIDSYHFFRIAPPLIIFLLLKLFHLEANAYNIVHTFLACNTFLILFTAWYYFLLCKHFKINKYPEIIGFAGLFLNFALLKQAYYYPVLTDVFAFAFGFFMVGEFMRGRFFTASIAFVLGTFTFPLFFLTSLFFLIPFKSERIHFLLSKIFSVSKWMLPILVFILFLIYIFCGKQLIAEHYYMQINAVWFYMSLPLLLYYLYKIFDVKILPVVESKSKFTELKIVLSLIGLILLYFLLNKWVKTITVPEDEFTSATFLWNVFQQAIAKPLSFIIFHFTYFGPAVLLCIFYYKKSIATASQFGWQLLAYIFMYLLLGMGSESRQFINAWPAFVVILVLAINQLKINKNYAIAFVIISIFQSHFWLQINRSKIYETYIYDKFPEQYYFMHHGPFATDVSYFINAISCIIIGVLFWYFIKKRNFIP